MTMHDKDAKLKKAFLTVLFSLKNHSKQLLFFSKYLLLLLVDIFKLVGLLVLMFFYGLQKLRDTVKKNQSERTSTLKQKRLQESFFNTKDKNKGQSFEVRV